DPGRPGCGRRGRARGSRTRAGGPGTGPDRARRRVAHRSPCRSGGGVAHQSGCQFWCGPTMTGSPEAASMEGVTEPYRWLAGADPGDGLSDAAPGGAAAPAVAAEAVVADAEAAAEAAARAAGVVVREISDMGGLAEVTQLFDEIWRPDPQNRPITTE